MPTISVSFAAILALFATSGCTVDENTVYEASTAASEAATEKDIEAEYQKTQDFDRIAEDSLQGVDTSSLSALE